MNSCTSDRSAPRHPACVRAPPRHRLREHIVIAILVRVSSWAYRNHAVSIQIDASNQILLQHIFAAFVLVQPLHEHQLAVLVRDAPIIRHLGDDYLIRGWNKTFYLVAFHCVRWMWINEPFDPHRRQNARSLPSTTSRRSRPFRTRWQCCITLRAQGQLLWENVTTWRRN